MSTHLETPFGVLEFGTRRGQVHLSHNDAVKNGGAPASRLLGSASRRILRAFRPLHWIVSAYGVQTTRRDAEWHSRDGYAQIRLQTRGTPVGRCSGWRGVCRCGDNIAFGICRSIRFITMKLDGEIRPFSKVAL